MNVEEFLRRDNSYLTVPHYTTNVLSKAFWKAASKEAKSTFAGSQGNQREATNLELK